MVKHLSSFPPSGNDSHVSGFHVTLLNETKLFLECSTCHYLLPSDVSALCCRQSTLNKVYLLLLREDLSVAPFAKSTRGYFFRKRF